MDAYASDTHIGMIYVTNPDGTDQIIEALGERMAPTSGLGHTVEVRSTPVSVVWLEPAVVESGEPDLDPAPLPHRRGCLRRVHRRR